MSEQTTNNFDGLRLLGSIMVLISHQFALAGHLEPKIFGIKLGVVGVLIFFTISGYLVAASWDRDPDMIRFILRRFLRVWPALAVCLTGCISFVCIAIIPPSDRAAIPNVLLSYLPNFAFIWFDGNYFRENPVQLLNGSLWTIPIEVQCYLALLFFGVLAKKHVRYIFIGLIIVVLIFKLSNNWTTLSANLPNFFKPQGDFNLPSFFLVGALLYFFPKLLVPNGSVLLLIVGLAALLANEVGLAFSVFLPMAVLRVGCKSWPILRSAGRFGDLSYGIYLWAWPVEQLGVLFLGRETYLPVLLAQTLLISVIMALLSWHLIEKPCLNFKPMPIPRRNELFV